MELTGEQEIAAPRERVWEALNDPEILRRAIPGCEQLEQVGDDRFEATVKASIGPVRAPFRGHVTLADLNPPESYTLTGQGQGGAAGFAKGSAEVKLAELDGARTRLTYAATGQVGGKLASIGARLVDSAAKKIADEFFANFKSEVEGPAPAPAEAAVPPAAEPVPPEAAEAPPMPEVAADKGRGLRPIIWGALVVAAVAALLLLL